MGEIAMSREIDDDNVCPVCEGPVIKGQTYCSASCERLDTELVDFQQFVDHIYEWVGNR